MTLRIGVAGLQGRMGRLVAQEILAAGCLLSGGTHRPGAAVDRPEILPDLAELAAVSDVVIDFTHASTACAHAATLASARVAWVLGSSGLSRADEAAVTAASRRIPVVHAANFAPAATIAVAFAERLARALPAALYDAEIVEMHHRQKVDAPSGTAIALGRAVQAGRGEAAAGGERTNAGGGPRPTGGVGYASLRGGQVVGEHTLLFAGASEHLALTHRAFDRRAFATGAVQAACWLSGRAPGLYGMTDVLGLG